MRPELNEVTKTKLKQEMEQRSVDRAQRQSGSPQNEMIQLDEQSKQSQQDIMDYAEPPLKPVTDTITAIALSAGQW